MHSRKASKLLRVSILSETPRKDMGFSKGLENFELFELNDEEEGIRSVSKN